MVGDGGEWRKKGKKGNIKKKFKFCWTKYTFDGGIYEEVFFASNKSVAPNSVRGCGGMVDATDLEN
jgi:hypothetical protein